ncbi:MAG: hypothetical protein ACRDIX_03355 [Actinomycetota bacterium]
MSGNELESMPTSPEPSPLDRLRRARAGRRLLLSGLIGVLVLALANVLGMRTDSVTAAGGGYRLSVTYGSVSRPGLATPWGIEVHHPGGFQRPLTIATTRNYLMLFDHNVFYPDPSSVTATRDQLIFEFDPPPGEVFRMTMDGRIEPTEHVNQSAETSVLVDGLAVVTVHYTTRVVP